jgi:transposase InsO family protein
MKASALTLLAGQNSGLVESCNPRLRADDPTVEVYYKLADAQFNLTVYRQFYHEEQPHSSLGQILPASFGAQYLAGERA